MLVPQRGFALPDVEIRLRFLKRFSGNFQNAFSCFGGHCVG